MFSSTTPYLERNVPIEGFEDLADRLFHAFVPPFAPSQPPRACPANVPDFSQSDGSPPMFSLTQSPLCRPTQPKLHRPHSPAQMPLQFLGSPPTRPAAALPLLRRPKRGHAPNPGPRSPLPDIASVPRRCGRSSCLL